jgi:hypothetical protein
VSLKTGEVYYTESPARLFKFLVDADRDINSVICTHLTNLGFPFLEATLLMKMK